MPGNKIILLLGLFMMLGMIGLLLFGVFGI